MTGRRESRAASSCVNLLRATLLILVAACGPAPEASTPVAAPALDAVVPARAAAPPVEELAFTLHPLDVAPRAGHTSMAPLTDPGLVPFLAIGDESEKTFPLTKTRVRATVGPFFADVTVTQRFENRAERPLEAIYVFPLPENAAVYESKMVVGDRETTSVVEERQRARATYGAAKRQGFSASLLEQERANVLTQSVANVAPGTVVEITTRYRQDLARDEGVHELVFPMVVGPRFAAGRPLKGAPVGKGTSRDTTDVPDASRLSPPSAERSGQDIELEVTSLVPWGEIETPTHEVVRTTANGRETLMIAKRDRIPNRDFILRYRLRDPMPRALLLEDPARGYFSLMIDAPAGEAPATPRELLFVVDVSGSMRGEPLATCQAAIREALRHLRAGDRFNIHTFAGTSAKAFPTPRRASSATIEEGLAFIERAAAGGGTEMVAALDEAFREEGEGERFVFFLTDGFVSVEDELMAKARHYVGALASKSRSGRIFGVGIGASPNRALLEGLSREGRGVAVYASNRESPLRAVNQLYRFIDRSIMKDVSIDWGGRAVADVFPPELPDLFADHAIVVHGRIGDAGTGRPRVVGTGAHGPIEIPVERVVVSEDERAVGSRAHAGPLGALWARAKIERLERDLVGGDKNARRAITETGIRFGLTTRFTSLVGVDWGRYVGAGGPSIVQPVELPEEFEAPRTTEAPDAAGAAPPQDAPSVERSARGCYCNVIVATDASDGGLGWLLLAWLFIVRRSRERPSLRWPP